MRAFGPRAEGNYYNSPLKRRVHASRRDDSRRTRLMKTVLVVDDSRIVRNIDKNTF